MPRPIPVPVRQAIFRHWQRDQQTSQIRVLPRLLRMVVPGHASRQYTVSIRGIMPRAAEARGYGGVEDPPMPLYAALVCAALTVVMTLAVPRRESRLARLRPAQEKWAEQMDRRW